jgi:hypothetical protein
MHRSLFLLMLTAAIVSVTTLVAAAAAAFLWGGMLGFTAPDRASSGLMAAVYAPFALVALLLPVLSAPMARFALRFGPGTAATTAPAPPLWLGWILLFGGAEAFAALARAAAGESPINPAFFVHGLLAGYAAAAAHLLRKPTDHARDTSANTP